MKIDAFQAACLTTAIYPRTAAIYYPALGLSGEAGEIANKAKKTIRGDYPLDEQRKVDLLKELGDVLWYTAAVASDVGANLLELQVCSHKLVAEGDFYSLTLRLQEKCGLIAGEAEFTRNVGSLMPGSVARIVTLLANVLRLAAGIAERLDSSLEAVCQATIDKLMSRRERGTLKGDGDNR